MGTTLTSDKTNTALSSPVVMFDEGEPITRRSVGEHGVGDRRASTETRFMEDIEPGRPIEELVRPKQ